VSIYKEACQHKESKTAKQQIMGEGVKWAKIYSTFIYGFLKNRLELQNVKYQIILIREIYFFLFSYEECTLIEIG